jgi:acetoin utilization deacetylase AcuC-like enzyme
MSNFGLLLDDRFERHLAGPWHPERPERLQAISEGLAAERLIDRCARIEAEPAPLDLLQQLHTPEYLERLKDACAHGRPYIDVPDSGICRESYDIARLAAGGVVRAARMIARGGLRGAFCAIRPPGHHAERDRSMGFCLLNNAALAAHVLCVEFGCERVLILDIDVHHGNGTQHTFDDDPAVFYASLHGHPDYLYPGTGYEDEVGSGPGRGRTLNVTLLPGTGDEEYRERFLTCVLPAIEAFRPRFVVLSVGFDAHADDPIGNLRLSDGTFSWLAERIVELADAHAEGRILSVLEGGYNLDVLRRCVPAHVRILARMRGVPG